MVLTANIFFNVLRLAFVGTKTGLVEKTQRKNTVLETLALDLAASHTQFAHRSYSGLKTPLAYAVGEKVLHIHPYSISRMIIYIYRYRYRYIPCSIPHNWSVLRPKAPKRPGRLLSAVGDLSKLGHGLAGRHQQGHRAQLHRVAGLVDHMWRLHDKNIILYNIHTYIYIYLFIYLFICLYIYIYI